MRRQRIHRHEETFTNFGQQDACAGGSHGRLHSFLRASTRFIRAARQAGKKPDSTPVTSETSIAMLTMIGDIVAGMTLRITRVNGHASAIPMSPPNRHMLAASIKN